MMVLNDDQSFLSVFFFFFSLRDEHELMSCWLVLLSLLKSVCTELNNAVISQLELCLEAFFFCFLQGR